ncbi:GTPase activating protein [Schizophyllum commune]
MAAPARSPHRRRSASPGREFTVSVETYIPPGATLRAKPPRKKSESRDWTASGNDDPRKLKEKSSWLGAPRGVATSGHWRQAKCRLTEDGALCQLKVYVDESILYHSTAVNQLHHTDIRLADSSLFFRKDVIAISLPPGRPGTAQPEPLYLKFFATELCNAWLVLLRSYAVAEVYGRHLFPQDGGAYRMWRQVDMTVMQGRNLGCSKLYNGAGSDARNSVDSPPEADTQEIDVTCDIHINDMLCGRTTVKKGAVSPDWHETFLLSDLPPFETLRIVVWREKKLFKPTVLGSVHVTLSNFKRGEMVEGWFPVLASGPVGGDTQVGDLRLRLRVDEEIILPYSCYSGLLTTFNSRNFLDWMADCEAKLKLKAVASQLMSVAIAKDVFLEQVQELASRTVDGTPHSHSTLFRGNTTLTKVMELCMAWYGKAFLDSSIGAPLRRLCAEKVAIEVDPVRSGKGPKDIERNVETLIYWCQEFWNQIYSVRDECPREMRRLFETIRKLVDQRYRVNASQSEQNRELPWQSVSAFCFLRFIVPAILHPHLFGLYAGLPPPPVQRSLTLIAKVIQSLANLNATVQKEEFMRGVKDFLSDSRPAMIDYLLVVSAAPDESYGPSTSSPERHARLNIMHCLRTRGAHMSVLQREAIPILPHLLDIPRHLAIIASSVVRHSREFREAAAHGKDGERAPMDELCACCLQVEETALQRVSQLVSRVSVEQHGQVRTHVAMPSASTVMSTSSSNDSPPASLRSKSKQRKMQRPSTAPSSPDTEDSPRRRMFCDPLPPSPVRRYSPSSEVHARPTAESTYRRPPHIRATSTDSIPSKASHDGAGSPSRMDYADELKPRRGLWRGILRL